MKEATSIFELKFKLDEVDDVSPNARKKCRMDFPMSYVLCAQYHQSFIWPLVQHIAISYLCKSMIRFQKELAILVSYIIHSL